MTFGRLTTKWRIFCSDLLSEHGTQKNCQIIRVVCKLHNYVIEADNLNFIKIDDDDFKTLEVDPLIDVPDGNRGYLPTFDENITEVGGADDRQKIIVETLEEMELYRPDRNLSRNSDSN